MTLIIDAGFESLPKELNEWSVMNITKKEAEVILTMMHTIYCEWGDFKEYGAEELKDKIFNGFPSLKDSWTEAFNI